MAGSSSAFKFPPLPPPLQPKEFEISRPLWDKCLKKSICALYTPFVVCLASGKLTVHEFRHYLSQNFHFLTASVRALKMLEKYAVADDDKTKLVELRMSALNELKDFDKVWGLETVYEHLLAPTTKKYTDFLLATASGEIDGGNAVVLDKSKIIHYTLGVLVARLRLFAFFFKEIRDLLNATDRRNFHREQIEKSLKIFQASAGNTEDLLDKLSAGLTKDEYHMIEELYHKAIELQIEFLSVLLQEEQETVIPLCKHLDPELWRLLLGSGFEMTCTAVDSYASLTEISILSAPMAKKYKPVKGRISRKSYAECQKKCDAIRKEYKVKFVKLINESVLKSEKVEGYSHERLSEALKVVSEFEENVLEKAIDKKLLKGIKHADVQHAGERLILRDGCRSFLEKLAQNEDLDVNVHVLSSFGCQELIMAALESDESVDVNVHANELYYNVKRISTGHVIVNIESGHDKFTAFEDLVLKDFGDWKPQFSVYIGSTVGDLMCLLKADIGIVIGSCHILRNVGRHFGVSFEPLFRGIVRRQKDVDGAFLAWDEPAGTLYIVHSWAEIQAFLLGFS